MTDDEPSALRRAAAIQVALGSFAVVVTSTFYALAPPLAVLPMRDVPVDDAIAATLAGSRWMLLAGTTGVSADVLLATGALMMAFGRRGPGAALATTGWIWLSFTCLVFVVVDALGGFVLPSVAALGGPAYLGFRQLFDALFAVGTVAFGVGGLGVTLAPDQLPASVPAWVRVPAALTAALGLGSAAIWFAGGEVGPVLGLAIGAGSLAFAVLGTAAARRPALRAELGTVSTG